MEVEISLQSKGVINSWIKNKNIKVLLYDTAMLRNVQQDLKVIFITS
jgi:hypothetical protein